jgi:hypothetical protein|nr:MAG TPA: Helix-turn-helix XRE-family like protein [Caudoviricetes sp.]
MNTLKIGNELKKLRGNKTQEEIADAIGVSSAAIGMYERGERIPRDEIKVKLANYFNASVESIFFTT